MCTIYYYVISFVIVATSTCIGYLMAVGHYRRQYNVLALHAATEIQRLEEILNKREMELEETHRAYSLANMELRKG